MPTKKPKPDPIDAHMETMQGRIAEFCEQWKSDPDVMLVPPEYYASLQRKLVGRAEKRIPPGTTLCISGVKVVESPQIFTPLCAVWAPHPPGPSPPEDVGTMVQNLRDLADGLRPIVMAAVPDLLNAADLLVKVASERDAALSRKGARR